ncbi:MAG: hypothetical protein P1R58_13110 [bacterium]|nr:hypothetical protein [bacterium]
MKRVKQISPNADPVWIRITWNAITLFGMLSLIIVSIGIVTGLTRTEPFGFAIKNWRIAAAPVSVIESVRTNKQAGSDLEIVFSGQSSDAFRSSNLQAVFKNILDSLEDHASFIPRLPQGCVKSYINNKKTSIVFEYYLDCGCPTNMNSMDILMIATDIGENGEPAVSGQVLIEGVSREFCPSVSIAKGVLPIDR